MAAVPVGLRTSSLPNRRRLKTNRLWTDVFQVEHV